jgi:3-dehydroquinate synthase
LGHTFGHAIEAGMGYGSWLHGEAVGAGTAMAADLSRRLGWLSKLDCQRVENLLVEAGLPVRAPKELSAHRFRELMAVDKKVSHGQLNLVLLQSIGKAVVSAEYTEEQLMATLTEHPNSDLPEPA